MICVRFGRLAIVRGNNGRYLRLRTYGTPYNHNTTGYLDLIPMGSAFQRDRFLQPGLIPMGSASNNCPGRDNISVEKKTIDAFLACRQVRNVITGTHSFQ